MEMSVELFDSIINTSQDCVFWKDADRRFLGVNQAFLDFYGFESQDILIGKNDEEMGWHNDPEPYKRDELRVLAGESTYKVPGKCIIRGEERDIIASKRPLYENGRIVGLVGSFIDVTDVIKLGNRYKDGQYVYSSDMLRKYPYFDRLIDEKSIDMITDHLTGIISREFIVDYVHSLIAGGTPFSFTILDLDNFKHINDGFGHSAGDAVLKDVSEGLAMYMEGYGVVGRFGGDELLLVNLRDTTSESSKKFFEEMYGCGSVLRKDMEFDDGSAFITGTAGCALYPGNADNYEKLFSLADKALYVGKHKGRNCFTVYDEKKHASVEVRAIAKQSIYEVMHTLIYDTAKKTTVKEKLEEVFELICESLQVNDIFYTDTAGHMHSVTNGDFDEDVSDIVNIAGDDLYKDYDPEEAAGKSPKLVAAFEKHEFRSMICARIASEKDSKCYVMCAVRRNHRIWQETEYAFIFFLSRQL